MPTSIRIQMITGFCSLINGGYYYEPHMVSKITAADGSVVKNIGFCALLIARVTCWIFLYSHAAIQRQQTAPFANYSSNTASRVSLLPINCEAMARL